MKTLYKDIIIFGALLAFVTVLLDDLIAHRQYTEKERQLHEALRMVDKLLAEKYPIKEALRTVGQVLTNETKQKP